MGVGAAELPPPPQEDTDVSTPRLEMEMHRERFRRHRDFTGLMLTGAPFFQIFENM